MKKVVLITGASSGMGRETAIRLSMQGYTVYAVLGFNTGFTKQN